MKKFETKEVTDPAELEEVEEQSFTFKLSLKEQQHFLAWRQMHDEVCKIRDEQTAIGGRFTFCFVQTSVGDVVKIRCACGEEKDVTDYDSW